LCRVMYRLGLAPTPNYDDPETVQAVIAAAQKFAETTGHTMHYVDLIIVNFGRVGLGMRFPDAPSDRGICVDVAPQCNLCQVRPHCQFYQRGFAQGEITVDYMLGQAQQLSLDELEELVQQLKQMIAVRKQIGD